jgi:hypothetical protein
MCGVDWIRLDQVSFLYASEEEIFCMELINVYIAAFLSNSTRDPEFCLGSLGFRYDCSQRY